MLLNTRLDKSSSRHLWANDVRDEEQQRAVDQFLTDCVQVSEDVTLQVDPSLMASIFAGRRHSAVDGGPEDPAAEQEANSSAAEEFGLGVVERPRAAQGEQLHSDEGDFQEDSAPRPSGGAAKKKVRARLSSAPTCN